MQVQRMSTVMPVRPAAVRAGGGEVAVAPQPTPVQANADMATMYRLIDNPQDLGNLSRWGLGSPGMLRFAAGGSIRRAIASFLTGVPTDRLIVYGQMADMMRVPGMQPDYANLLVSSGVPSPGDLSRYAGNDITATVQRGILYAAVLAKSIEKVANTGHAFATPSYTDLASLSQASIGLGSTINIGQPVQTAPAYPTR